MFTGSFNVGGWTTGSSLISLGLNVWQSMIAIVIAHTFVGFAIRVFLSFVWTATNTWYGSQCLRVLLTCIWPSYLNLDSELADGTIKVYDLISFVLYFLLCLPLIWFSPENYRKPFLFASTTVATTVLVLLIWCTTRAGGGGALLADVRKVSGIEPAQGGDLGWAFVAAVTANIGGIATHMWSQPDYTRYARKPGDQVLAQLIMVPLGTIIVACIGIICTSSNSGARAGVAFATIAFMLSQFGMVIASNCVVAGIGLAALLPRWFTIRRGGYFTIVFVFVIQPWSLLNSASNFLTVVGSFNRTIKLTDLYGDSPASIYWYTKGWNLRAAVSWRAMAPSELPWFVGCLVSGSIYLAFDRIWSIPEKQAVDELDYFGTFGDAPVAELDASSISEAVGEKSRVGQKVQIV
ncbi:permease for cytosine/purines, uracil, thiamine, allantoin-domain-containing protein [Colletotrichum godetiae]|uniref:Permease for cytosine/purines, uracil, thiamine, allantoin-domain-containing protein n=1 Tax=Colletotrichum godetiae TaxID=1209918 RepID=A0AAJ0EUS6_9PEZI|nr:permease for cytosine/purines, uracil, thiamine, allantoin-domain-containing protein [Colletotrichum godetiae]KAK1674648.1 permease for cytosine/purines, uracil, thiamine, allantoin-domain-containing protein [Colletotrichum godetiae]